MTELKPANLGINKFPRPTDDYGQNYNTDSDESKWSGVDAQETRKAHVRADTDISPKALHHTLGPGRNQSSPGNHVHDGTTSKKLGALEMDPSNPGKTRPALTIADGYTLKTVVDFLKNFIEFRDLGNPGIKAGSVLVSFVGLSSHTQAVAFPAAFPVGATPKVTTNIVSTGGNTIRWGSRATGISNTGFTLFLFKGDAADAAQTWTNVEVQWIAHI